jgi:hypothetical protein
MAVAKYNARDIVFQIENYASPGTWVAIAPLAINTFTKSEEEETTDTTTFGSAGQAESMKMQIGKSLQLEGFRLRDPATGALDPGQAIVEAMNDRLGTSLSDRLPVGAHQRHHVDRVGHDPGVSRRPRRRQQRRNQRGRDLHP